MKHWFSLQMLHLMTLVLPANSHIVVGNTGTHWAYFGEKDSCVHAIVEILHHEYKFSSASVLSHYLQQAFSTDSFKGLCQVDADGERPDHWYLDYPHCGGNRQSPVNIQTVNVIRDSQNLVPFEMKGYDSTGDLQMDLENNGHTIQINLKDKGMSITGGNLSNVYIAHQFHFHWGKNNKRGSEHAIDGKYFPMEMHIVHYNLKHNNFSQALNKQDGLAVLSFFFQVGKNNVNLDPVIQRFPEIPNKDDHTTIQKLALRNLLPKTLDGYFRYHGSLTTPPCYESVQWSIFNEPINISQKQLQSFRNKVHQNFANETNRDISDDYRPLQPLNQRTVYSSK